MAPDERAQRAAEMARARRGAIRPLAGDPGGGSFPTYMQLNSYGHQQDRYYYWGPAVVQTIEQYRRGSAHSQATIGDSTPNVSPIGSGGTAAGEMQTMLNYWVPLPSGFTYLWVQPSSDTDWYNKTMTDVGLWFMPQAITVAPHDINATYYLPSWPNAIDAGHWIDISGYTGTVLSSANVTYDDSSGGYQGTTGTFSVSATTMRYTNMRYSTNHPAVNYIVW